MIRRLLPLPLFSLILWLTWLLLSGFSVGQALLGLGLAIALPLMTAPFLAGVPRVRRPLPLLVFMMVVLRDILLANLTVAWLILRPSSQRRPAFVSMSLELDNEFTIEILAGVVSLAPGSTSVDISTDRRTLLIHTLDIDDPDALVAQIRERYERRIKEIFQC